MANKKMKYEVCLFKYLKQLSSSSFRKIVFKTKKLHKDTNRKKTNKALGLDGISNEFVILNREHLMPTLGHFFNEVLPNEIIPFQWAT